MNCPNCNVTLVLSERQGIEIDYCPTCRGIWLDRGELDKIIERSTSVGSDQNYQHKEHSDNHNQHDSHNQHDNHNQYGNYNQHDNYKNHKKKNWLNELFD